MNGQKKRGPSQAETDRISAEQEEQESVHASDGCGRCGHMRVTHLSPSATSYDDGGACTLCDCAAWATDDALRVCVTMPKREAELQQQLATVTRERDRLYVTIQTASSMLDSMSMAMTPRQLFNALQDVMSTLDAALSPAAKGGG